MKLKNSIYSLLAVSVLLVAATACKDSYLDEKIYSTYGTNVTDVNAKIIGLHYKIGEILGYCDHQGYLGIWQDGTDVGAPGDVEGVETPFYKYAQLTSENAGVKYLWSQLYSIINAANQIIGDEENPTPAQYAEARFFRAYAYDQLVTGWGKVPLLTESISTPSTDFTRAEISEVDAVIEEDLTYAIANLPTVDNLVNESRISQDAARMQAGTSYLRMGMRDASYFAKAEEAVSPIITGGNYQLISERYGQFTGEYGDYYHDMFRWGNQRRSQGNTEGIWTFEMEYDADVNGGTIGSPQHRRNWTAAFYKLDGMVNADSIGGRGNGRLRLSNYVKYGLFE
ncbi:MAG: RagB/SusD family nutrient uptake outer membrane protein, partial [Prevotellaceae bacterium]|nr:RagB/SusD family nutrient uptake outer membrane protein [Prevotellaceae bacterium]